MNKAQATRRFILERTAPIFNKKGYDGTSLADLTQATGLTKGALYGHFADKEEMAAAAFRYSVAKVRATVSRLLQDQENARLKLEALVDFYATYVFDPPVPGGCPLLNMAIEADDHVTAMRKVVADELLNTVQVITGLLDLGKRQGVFSDSFDSREFAYTLFCLIEGGLMFARAEGSKEPMEIVVRHARQRLAEITIKQ